MNVVEEELRKIVRSELAKCSVTLNTPVSVSKQGVREAIKPDLDEIWFIMDWYKERMDEIERRAEGVDILTLNAWMGRNRVEAKPGEAGSLIDDVGEAICNATHVGLHQMSVDAIRTVVKFLERSGFKGAAYYVESKSEPKP